jgi:hypothetical protein
MSFGRFRPEKTGGRDPNLNAKYSSSGWEQKGFKGYFSVSSKSFVGNGI